MKRLVYEYLTSNCATAPFKKNYCPDLPITTLKLQLSNFEWVKRPWVDWFDIEKVVSVFPEMEDERDVSTGLVIVEVGLPCACDFKWCDTSIREIWQCHAYVSFLESGTFSVVASNWSFIPMARHVHDMPSFKTRVV